MHWSDKYIGIPFRDGGRGFDGCDCGGLVLLVLREECGLEARDTWQAYTKRDFHTRSGHVKLEGLLRDCLEDWRKLGAEAPRPFDVALYAVYGVVCHCASVVDARRALHVDEGCPAHILALREAYGPYEFVGAYRHASMF